MNPRSPDKAILEDVSLSINAGKIVTVIGPNGAGKTTLLRVLLGLMKPSKGEIWKHPGLKFGYLPQKVTLNPSLPLTVQRLLEISRPESNTTLAPKIHAVLAQVGMAHTVSQDLKTLSGGELQRVLLARALLETPDILVLDEPLQGVDVIGQADLYSLIARIRDDLGCAVLLVSHDLHLVMAASDIVLCLNVHICCSGSPQQVTDDPAYRSLFGVSPYIHHHDHHHDHHVATPTEPRDA
jgi:zinc transport system ATP-binding protein